MLKTVRDPGVTDVKKQPENEYAEHCRIVDISARPFRDCVIYYNGHGDSGPGSFGHYGGGRWHRCRIEAQAALDPYIFDAPPDRV